MQEALKASLVSSIDEARELESTRLDALQAAVWPKAMAGDVRAVLTVLKIMEREPSSSAFTRLNGRSWSVGSGRGTSQTAPLSPLDGCGRERSAHNLSAESCRTRVTG